MSKIFTYVDSHILLSVKITLHFDDDSIQEKTYKIGDYISIDYIKEKVLVSTRGVLKKITSQKDIILVVDASTESNSAIENIPVENIRKLHDILTLHGTIINTEIGPNAIISGNNAIFTGEIPYASSELPHGNMVEVRINLPDGIEDTSQAVYGDITLGEFPIYSELTSYPDHFIYKCRVTEVDQLYKISIKWSPEVLEEEFNIIIADAVLLPEVEPEE